MAKPSVCIERSESYNYKEVREGVNRLIEGLGGLSMYFQPGEKIFLKMNLLIKKRPEEGVTTHPIFVQAVGDALKEFGCHVIIGDSPGGPFTKGLLKAIYKTCGVEKIAEESGFTLNYNTEGVTKKVNNGKVLQEITVMKALEEVEHVISLSKLKTHGMMKYTGAVKNMYGIIPGLIKAEYHFKMPAIETFSDMLVDVCSFKEPTLSFMDGIVGMEGEGPSSGDLRKVGAMIASSNPYALDFIACQLVGIDPLEVPTIQRSIERNFLSGNHEDIHIVGSSMESFSLKPFITPAITDVNFFKGRVPEFLVGPMSRFLLPRPVFDHEICVSCGDCGKVCPAQVISFKKTKGYTKGKPYADLTGCIRCFCCQELCPVKAVRIKRSKIGARLFKL